MKQERKLDEPNNSRAKPSAHDGHAALCSADRHRYRVGVSVMRDSCDGVWYFYPESREGLWTK